MSDLLSFKPTRDQQSGSVLVADLDALVSRSFQFRLHGKVHELKPVSTQRYLDYIQAMGRLSELRDKTDHTPQSIAETTLSVFQPLIPSLTKEDLMDATQEQIRALFSMVVKQVEGRLSPEIDEKKKSVMADHQPGPSV